MNLQFETNVNSQSPRFNTKSMFVSCPNAHCKEYIHKSELENHRLKQCPMTVVSCNNSLAGCNYKATRKDMTEHEFHCPYQRKSPESSLTSVTLSSTSSVFQTDGTSSQDPNHSSTHQNNNSNIIANNSFYTPLQHLDNESNIEDFCLTITNVDRLELGISFVGGFDTPLQCIVIQEIFRDGLLAQDGRLRPGDQFVKINEYNLTRASHNECRDILNRICLSGDTIYLTIHRDSMEKKSSVIVKEEILEIILIKPPDKKIGLKLAGKTNKPGLYIQEVISDTLASHDGRLKKDDRVLKINDEDFLFGTQKEALEVMKKAQSQVVFLISRFVRPQTPDIIRATSSELPSNPGATGGVNAGSFDLTPIASSLSYPGLKNVTSFTTTTPGISVGPSAVGTSTFFTSSNGIGSPNLSSSHSSKLVYREELIEMEKQPGESLGMSVAGGVNSQRGDTPVYITSVAPSSVLRRAATKSTNSSSVGSTATHSVGKGDILLAVNDSELLGLSHERAVESLRQARDNFNRVTVRVLKVPNVNCTINSENFIPTWLYWLRLPSYCQIPRETKLVRDASTGSIGFSIVGGNDLVINSGSNGSIGRQITALNTETEPNINSSIDLRIQKEPYYRPIMVKSIVFGSPAYKNGRIKCGDILISINDFSLTNVSHSEAVNLFKSASTPLKLKVVSWPGTMV